MPVPVISVAQMREWENASWAAGRSPAAVIKNVGRSLARRALDLTLPGDTILILAGRGHNGDDARAARHSSPGAADGRRLPRRPPALVPAQSGAGGGGGSPDRGQGIFPEHPTGAGPRPSQAGRGRLVWHRLEPSAGRRLENSN